MEHQPLLNKITRMNGDDLEKLLAESRFQSTSKEIARAVLVDGKSRLEVSREMDISYQRVQSIIRKVKLLISREIDPRSSVELKLTLPIVLADALESFVAAIEPLEDSKAAMYCNEVVDATVQASRKAINDQAEANQKKGR